MAKYARMSKAELKEAVESDTISMIDLNIAAILANGANTGDHLKLAWLLDRALGKFKLDTKSDLSELSNEELLAVAKSHIKSLEGHVEEPKD